MSHKNNKLQLNHIYKNQSSKTKLDKNMIKKSNVNIKSNMTQNTGLCNIANFYDKMYNCNDPKPHMNLFCNFIKMYKDKNCINEPDINDLCNPNPCNEHYNCVQNNQDYSCIPDINYKPNLGDFCTPDFICAGNDTICKDNVCVKPCDPSPCDEHYICEINKVQNTFSCVPDSSYVPGFNEFCSEDFPCQSDYICNSNNLCKKKSGDNCVSNDECYSGICNTEFNVCE